jgi:DNA-binding MarR family transcriptional regulator
MIASAPGQRLEEVAQQFLDVMTQFCLTRTRGRRQAGDLKEVEFLTLAILHQRGTMIVGDIQRLLGVLPAQMSRIIRSLESRPRPLIACRINPQDKRKIDVRLTPAGEQALLDYQGHRLGSLVDVLRGLPEEDQEDLARLLDKMHDLLGRGRACLNGS